MKKISCILILVFSIACFSQNKQILYNFTSVPQSLLSNPGADVKYNWFVGIPLVSGFSLNAGSSGFSAYDLFANNGENFNDKLRKVVFSSSRNDLVATNAQLEIFSGGFKLRGSQENAYLSFGMYEELDVLAYMPKDYAILALDGNKNHLGKLFDLSDLNAKGELLSVLHVGYHREINHKLILGARAKIYSSVYNFSSINNSGTIYTRAGTNSIYDQGITSDILVNSSGLVKYINNYNNYKGDIKTDIINKSLLGGNLGLGFDVGLTYYPQENIQFTASLIDIGFIKQTKEIESYSLKGTYDHIGLRPDFVGSNSVKNFVSEFLNAMPLDTLHTKYTTWRSLKFNTSYQYSFGDGRSSGCNCGENEAKYTNSVGAQLYVMTTSRTPLMALTAYYRSQILESLEMKATYTIDSFTAKNLGLGLSTTIGKVNFYLLADNLLEYVDVSKANSLSFQLGLNIVFPDKI